MFDAKKIFDGEDVENLFSLRLINHFINNIFESVFFKVNEESKNQITRKLMNKLKSTEEQLLLGENVELYARMRQPTTIDPQTLYLYMFLMGIVNPSRIGYTLLTNPEYLIGSRDQILLTSIFLISSFFPLASRDIASDVVKGILNVKKTLFNHFKKLNYALSKNQFNQIFEQASIFFKKLILEKYVEKLLYKKDSYNNTTIMNEGRLAPMFNRNTQNREDGVVVEHPFFGSIVFELKTILDFKGAIRFSFVKINKENSTFLDTSFLPDWVLVPSSLGFPDPLAGQGEHYNFQHDIEAFDSFINELGLNKNTKVVFLEKSDDLPLSAVSKFTIISLLGRISKYCQLIIPGFSFNMQAVIKNPWSVGIENINTVNYFKSIIKELQKNIMIIK